MENRLVVRLGGSLPYRINKISLACGISLRNKWKNNPLSDIHYIHNVALNDLHSSPNIIRVIKLRMIWAREVARTGKGRGVYRNLMGKSEGKRPLGRPRRI